MGICINLTMGVHSHFAECTAPSRAFAARHLPPRPPVTNNLRAKYEIDAARAWLAARIKDAPPLLRAAFVWLFTRSLFTAIVALVGAVAGLAASVNSTELKAVIPLLRESASWSSYSGDAVVSIGLFLAFFVLFALQQVARNMQESEARVALFAETDKLKQLVGRLETLPPDGFLQQFQSLYQDVAALQLLAYREDTTQDAGASAIRSVLSLSLPWRINSITLRTAATLQT